MAGLPDGAVLSRHHSEVSGTPPRPRMLTERALRRRDGEGPGDTGGPGSGSAREYVIRKSGDESPSSSLHSGTGTASSFSRRRPRAPGTGSAAVDIAKLRKKMQLCREIMSQRSKDLEGDTGGPEENSMASPPRIEDSPVVTRKDSGLREGLDPTMDFGMAARAMQNSSATDGQLEEMRQRMLLCKQMLAGTEGEMLDEAVVSDERLQRELLAKVAKRDMEIMGLRGNMERLEKTEMRFATAASAVGGATVVGTSFALAGAAVGGTIGVALGVVPAVFTLGLSIPVAGLIGSGCGMLVGSASGTVVGAAGGGTVGYGVFTHRSEIRAYFDGADAGSLLGRMRTAWGGPRPPAV